MQKVLVCTVGGSHQPIVSAIAELKPDYVVFLCSEDDPATGRKGSYTQIEGAGHCIKARPEDDRPSLPNIPAQAALDPSRFRVARVPADDLDTAFERMHPSIARFASEYPDARIVADYTGGTKTMSAALVLSALEAEGVDLQFITGGRADLVKIRDGSERAVPAAIEGLRLSRAMSLHLAAWASFGYEISARGLGTLAVPNRAALRAGLDRARDLSRAFAAWDRFDHGSALRIMEPYAPRVAPAIAAQYAALRLLAGPESARREGLLIWDLWLNALRRAADGRYDDAVARIYRAIEWSAQWVLRTRAGLDTADLAADEVPAGLLSPNREGKYQAGLFAAWQLVHAHTEGPAARFFGLERETLRFHLEARNASILAHGYKPVRSADWGNLRAWLEERFIPMLRAELSAVDQREVFPQLPAAYIWS